MNATEALPLPARLLALSCGLGIVSFVSSPWIVLIDWAVIRALYAWELLAFVQNSGGARSVAKVSCAIVVVGVFAAGVGLMVLLRPLRSRPLLQRGLLIGAVGILLAAYGALLVQGDLATFLIVAVDGDDLASWRRVAWLSGPALRATAVLASVSSAVWAFLRLPAPTPRSSS